MRKILLNFVLTIVLGIMFSFVLPWWSVMLAALLTGFMVPLKKISVFVVPFIAIALFWMVYSYLLSVKNDFILATRIANLLSLGENLYMLLLLTGVVGGFSAGVAGILGKRLRLLISSEQN